MTLSELETYGVATVDQFRRLHCKSYNRCLSVASDREWPGFHCGNCQAFEPLDHEQLVSDVTALNVLQRVLDAGKTAGLYLFQDRSASDLSS